jgi:hypothetical protein
MNERKYFLGVQDSAERECCAWTVGEGKLSLMGQRLVAWKLPRRLLLKDTSKATINQHPGPIYWRVEPLVVGSGVQKHVKLQETLR